MTEAGIKEQQFEFMKQALELAETASSEGEVPVGAVVVRDNKIVGRGYNQTITQQDPSAHAEIIAMRAAGKHLGNYRLPGCDLYVTLEPCAMCAGAIIHARLSCVIYAASDPKTGADGGCFDLLQSSRHNHHPEVVKGVLKEESSDLLVSFFKERRRKPG